jgi:hypothetical protein
MRKSFATLTIEDDKTIASVASQIRTETPLQHWSRLHLEFLQAEQAKHKYPKINSYFGA